MNKKRKLSNSKPEDASIKAFTLCLFQHNAESSDNMRLHQINLPNKIRYVDENNFIDLGAFNSEIFDADSLIAQSFISDFSNSHHSKTTNQHVYTLQTYQITQRQ